MNASRARARLLVVEDDRITRDALRELLEAEGYVCAGAATLDEAIAAPTPDAVLLDLGLPDGEGLLLLETLRARPGAAHLPVLVVTGRDDVEWLERAFAAGASDYLRKPIDATELLTRLRAAVDRGRAAAERARLERELRAAQDRATTQLARALDEAKARYAVLFEHAPHVVLLASGTRIVDANAAAEAVFGRSRTELARHELGDLGPDLQDGGRTTPELIEALLAIGQSAPWTVRGPRGAVLRLHATVRAVPLPEVPDARLLTAHDVTRQEALERELQQAQRLATLGLLATTTAHDFNNLLSAVMGFVDISLARQGLEEPGALARNLHEIKRAAERAGQLSRDLLAFGRRSAEARAPFELDSVVAGTRSLLGRLVGARALIDEALASSPARVFGEPAKLEQVLVNLVLNARDAMPAGGTIRIATGVHHAREASGDLPAGEFVTLAVADTGVGMTDAVRARIFEPFFTTKRAGGTGLGLAIVHGIVEQHGGRVRVESRPGAGTTFTVFLPAHDREGASPVPHRDEAPRGVGPWRPEVPARRLFESNVIGIATADFGGRILEANDAFLAMLGYGRDDLARGLRWDRITPPEYADRDARAIAQLRERGTCDRVEKELIRKDGTRLPILYGAALLDGSAHEAVAFVLDLSDRPNSRP